MPKIERDDFWPEDKLTALILLAKDGYSAREIGERLGYGKNAVIGKARRNKIHLNFKAAGYLQSTRYGRKGKEPTDDMPPKGPLPDRGLCQWPLGDFWCGCAVSTGAYCEAHNAIAYTGQPALTIDDINFLIKGA